MLDACFRTFLNIALDKGIRSGNIPFKVDIFIIHKFLLFWNQIRLSLLVPVLYLLNSNSYFFSILYSFRHLYFRFERRSLYKGINGWLSHKEYAERLLGLTHLTVNDFCNDDTVSIQWWVSLGSESFSEQQILPEGGWHSRLLHQCCHFQDRGQAPRHVEPLHMDGPLHQVSWQGLWPQPRYQGSLCQVWFW